MKYKEVNLIEKLGSRFAYGIEIDQANDFLQNDIFTIKEPTLVVFDFRQLVFDHYFASSFGPLFKSTTDQSYLLDIIFRLDNYQIDRLLLGLLESQKLKHTNDSEEPINVYFAKNLGNIKLIIGGSNEITFVYNEDTNSEKVLTYIKNKNNVTADQLYRDRVITNMVDLVHKLEELSKGRLIYMESSDAYCSVYNYLKSSS